MADTTPTHIITHRPSGTRAAVRIHPDVEHNLDSDDDALRDGAEKHVAIAFKRTRPMAGGDMSRRYVSFGTLDIAPITRGGEPGEPDIPMDHHGDPIDFD